MNPHPWNLASAFREGVLNNVLMMLMVCLAIGPPTAHMEKLDRA